MGLKLGMSADRAWFSHKPELALGLIPLIHRYIFSSHDGYQHQVIDHALMLHYIKEAICSFSLLESPALNNEHSTC